HFWSGAGVVQNLSRAAVTAKASGVCTTGTSAGRACKVDADCGDGSCVATWVAALVSEHGQNSSELNNDGDTFDDVVEVHSASDPTPAWTNVGQAADELDAVGNLVVFLTPEAAQ